MGRSSSSCHRRRYWYYCRRHPLRSHFRSLRIRQTQEQ